MRWLVDGMNVIGARPDGWWRDRRGAMRSLTEELDEFAEESGDEVAVVFDGRPFDIHPRAVLSTPCQEPQHVGFIAKSP